MATESSTLRIALCAGGVSKQAPESRSRSQVETASNIDVSLPHGSSRRNGSRHLAVLSGVSTLYNHWLTRCQTSDGSDVLVNTDSNGGVRVFDTATYTAQTVIDLSGTYLSSGSPSRHAIAVVGDDILISNPNVAMEATNSPSVSSAGQRDSYDSLEPYTGTPGAVYRAREDGAGRGAGLYRYMPGTGTYATATFTACVTGTSSGDTFNFCHANQNPRGFRLFYSRFKCDSTTAVYSTVASAGGTLGLISSGLVLTGYVFEPGDCVYCSASAVGAVTPGAYPIAGYSGGILYLEGLLTGAGAGNVSIRGIGKMVEINENFHVNPVDTMDQAAIRYTAALREAGLTNACCHWQWTNLTAYTGQFTITAGDGGPMSGFNSTYTTFAPTISGANDDTAGGAGTFAFGTSPTVVDGTGAYETFTTAPRDRWVPVAAPDQDDAVLDETTMPVRLRKVDVTSYAATATDLGAWYFYRLGDTSTNDTAKDTAGHSIGAYTNIAAGNRYNSTLVTGDGDASTAFDGTNDYVLASTWWALGNRDSVTIELLAQTTNAVATEKCLVHVRQTNDLYVTMNKTAANRITVYTGGGEYYCNVTGFNSGATKHLVVVATASGATVYVNGVAQSMTTVSGASGNPMIGTEQGAYSIDIGRRHDNSMFFSGTLDEVAVYPFAFTASLAAFRYAQVSAPGTGLWVIDSVPWGSRLSGDSLSNPIPNLVKNGSGALAIASWQSRFAIGGERFVLMSRVNDPYSFFVQDADTITDADPIERPCGSTKTARIRSLSPYHKVMVVDTDQGEQYEIGFSGDSLTPAGSTVDLSTSYATIDTPPVTMGDRLYFVASDGSGSQLLEYVIDDVSVSGSAERVGQHVEGYITSSDPILCSSPNDGVLHVVGRNSATRWRYQTAYVGNERRSQAWSSADASADEVLAACQVDGDLYTIVRRGSDYALEAVQCVYEAAGSWTYQPRMDGRVAATGVYSAPTTTWAVPAGITAAGITHAVKSDGTTVAVTVAGSNVTATGNYAGSYVLGRAYTHTLTLSRPFLRDSNDAPYTSIGLRWRRVTARLKNTMYAAMSVVVGARPASVKTRTATAPAASNFESWVSGDADNTTVSFTASDPRPFSLGALDIEFDAIPERQ